MLQVSRLLPWQHGRRSGDASVFRVLAAIMFHGSNVALHLASRGGLALSALHREELALPIYSISGVRCLVTPVLRNARYITLRSGPTEVVGLDRGAQSAFAAFQVKLQVSEVSVLNKPSFLYQPFADFPMHEASGSDHEQRLLVRRPHFLRPPFKNF